MNSPPGNHPCLGRQVIVKESTKTFKATVAMVSASAVSLYDPLAVMRFLFQSEEFPLSVET